MLLLPTNLCLMNKFIWWLRGPFSFSLKDTQTYIIIKRGRRTLGIKNSLQIKNWERLRDIFIN